MASTKETCNILWFKEVGIEDVPLVGGKNASLGEMYQNLEPKGVKIPNGFAVTAAAYRYFMNATGLDVKLHKMLETLEATDINNLRAHGAEIRHAILAEKLPEDLEEEIFAAYEELSKDAGMSNVDVAVRSSATAEDLPDASFAGQQETYLNVTGKSMLLLSCKRCFASLFTDRAISYRNHQGYDHSKIALSIAVQRMVRSDLATSGVMFSIDTETGFKDAVLINAAYGLGENVVGGAVNPDEYYVFKPTLVAGFRPILQKTLGDKALRMIYDDGGNRMTRNIPVSDEDRSRFALSDDDILVLARWAVIIEDHYSNHRGSFSPMDMEWAKDGKTGELFIVQARPETVQSQKSADYLETFKLTGTGEVRITGRAVGERIGQGKVHVIKSAAQLPEFKDGSVLVTDRTDPDWEPVMKKASAIVTNRGGRTCHAAIVSREMGLPAIVGTISGTEELRDGEEVTICCAEGDTGKVYKGMVPFETSKIDIRDALTIRPKTKIMMNLANPEEAFRQSAIPNDGCGLARMEFVVMNYIKAHPLALLDYAKLTDMDVKKQIDAATAGYDDKAEFFVHRLAHGVAMLAAAFYPKDVILRFSDFKTNEYAGLIGGAAYEPIEENPMIGFRGASRYYNERYSRGFALECAAVKMVRDGMGLTNLKVMIPFCRTVEEGRLVQAEMAKNGLARGENGLQVYVMCEIPSNVILADEFAEIFDGFSIGSNDLTQLTLGVDRDSEIVAHVFDERNAAVKKMITNVVAAAKAKGKKIGICGEAPSTFPDFAEFLVDLGIDSMSLTPDRVLQTTVSIIQKERNSTGKTSAPASVAPTATLAAA